MLNRSLSNQKDYNEFLKFTLKSFSVTPINRLDLFELSYYSQYSIEEINTHFKTMECLIEKMLDHVCFNFADKVQHEIIQSEYKEKRKLYAFIRLIRRFLLDMPEAQCVFHASFQIKIMKEKSYECFQAYLKLWRDTLVFCLSDMTSAVIAERIADTYLIYMQGDKRSHSIKDRLSGFSSAENFLVDVTRYGYLENTDEGSSGDKLCVRC